MPTARWGLGVAAVDGKIYAIGGADGGDIVNVNEMYDTITDTWITKKSMPTARLNFAIAVYKDKIYCIGGFYEPVKGLVTTDVTEVYNTKTDTWATLAAMPTERASLEASIVDDKIYVIGGEVIPTYYNPTSVLDFNEVYDITTNTWSTKKSLLTPASYYASAVVDDKIYIIKDNVQIYNPTTDSWNTGTAPQQRITGDAGATTGVYAPKKIYVIGPMGIFSSDLNQVYDPQTGNWSQGANMPVPRGQPGVAVVDDIIYTIGGFGESYVSSPSNLNQRYVPFGYGTLQPSSSSQSSHPIITETTAIIVGVAVAGTVIAVTGVTVYHFKHAPAKHPKQPNTPTNFLNNYLVRKI
jgi:N-acetylneuraminic acid mutarotase